MLTKQLIPQLEITNWPVFYLILKYVLVLCTHTSCTQKPELNLAALKDVSGFKSCSI